MLLLSRMSFEESRNTWETRENRISLPRWKKKKKIEVQLVCSFSNEISFIFIFILQQTTSIHSHSLNIIKSSKSKSKPGWEKKETKKMNIINNHRTNRKPHSFNAREENTNKLHSHNYLLFQHYVSAMNTRSQPMRIDTPQVTSADRDLSHWCFRRQFNRVMSESGVHDKRRIQLGGKWPSTTPQMTIHYSTQSNSLQEKAK